LAKAILLGRTFMKKTLVATCLVIPMITSCDLDKEMAKIEHKAVIINKYENVALKLAKENRELHAEVKRLEFEIQKLKNGEHAEAKEEGHGGEHGAKVEGHAVAYQAEHAEHKEEHKEEHKTEHKEVHAEAAHGEKKHGEEAHGEEHAPKRGIASIPAAKPEPIELKKGLKDLVEYKTYKWSADDMMKMADKEFKDKNFEKAAQFYTSLANYYPTDKHLDDEFYFKAGISSYESGNHHDWTIKHFTVLMEKWPTSQYFRSAKLWVALTHMKMGDKQKFFATVEEFRKKYRNTNEWKILSSYYEKIEEKTNE
jgi:TolA-binding protein